MKSPSASHPIRVGVFNTHPIQYLAPVWRHLAGDDRFRCTVYSLSDQGTTARVDPGFGTAVAWDVPLLDGYDHEFLARVPIDEAYALPIPHVEALLERERFDVVLLHGYAHAHSRQLLRLRHRGGYKVVMRAEFSDLLAEGRSRIRNFVRSMYLSGLYRRIDAFSSIGTDATEHLRRHGVSDDRIFVAPYSVDNELIDRQIAENPRDRSRAELGIDPAQRVILFSGKLIPRKQPLVLADAIARLADTSSVTVCYIGSGEQAAAVEARLRPILGPRLLMPGFVNQSRLGTYFAAADVFVLPTAHDTWGLVVNEAMQWGLPCIVSERAGCTRDLIVDGETGFLFRHDDVQGLASLLDRCLTNPELCQRIGQAARSRVAAFSSSAAAKGLGDAFVAVARERTS
jgi:glycosyltransferase involved in cell wall biosynthesis